MNRRDALKTMAGGLVTFLLPAPRKQIDLMAFCSKEQHHRYDINSPFELNDWTYATDTKAIVRVRPHFLDRAVKRGGLPPAAALPWEHQRLAGWKALKPIEPLMRRNTYCPDCDGTGFADCVPGSDCEYCGGGCERCDFRCVVREPGTPVCRQCKGEASGTFPTVVRIGKSYFDSRLYERVQRLGGDGVVAPFMPIFKGRRENYSLLTFKFDGGEGLLMSMDPTIVESDLVA